MGTNGGIPSFIQLWLCARPLALEKEKIKVIIVDDAAFMRKAVTDILQSDSRVEVIETAKDGFDGLEKIKRYRTFCSTHYLPRWYRHISIWRKQ